jgi:hypothetical protein
MARERSGMSFYVLGVASIAGFVAIAWRTKDEGAEGKQGAEAKQGAITTSKLCLLGAATILVGMIGHAVWKSVSTASSEMELRRAEQAKLGYANTLRHDQLVELRIANILAARSETAYSGDYDDGGGE